MFDYSRKQENSVFNQPKQQKPSKKVDHEEVLKALEFDMKHSTLYDFIHDDKEDTTSLKENKGNANQKTFTVPKGWSLSKIAENFEITIEALKETNRDKLKSWGDVQGFNAGETIIIPQQKKTPKKPEPEEIIDSAYRKYTLKIINMIELGNMLSPYAQSHPEKILEIMEDLPFIHRDNLAYSISSNSGDSELEALPQNLLLEMKDTLGHKLNTFSWSSNSREEARIAKVLERQNSVEGQINKLMDKDRMTAEEIAKVRPLIARLEESKQAKYYLQIQEKVQYKNQRNNESKPTANDIAGNPWMTKHNIKTAGDIMCNLTSLAMALETVGISNPSKDMQFEDYLEKHRLEKYGDEAKRTEAETMKALAEDLGAKTIKLKLHTSNKKKLTEKLLPYLEKGYGIALSAFSKASLKGHIVKLQNIENEGLRIDDPYGDVSGKLAERESGQRGYRYGDVDNRNKKDNENGIGENNLWLWKDIQKTIIKYAIIIKNE